MPSCGTENKVSDTLHAGHTYHCGSCKALIELPADALEDEDGMYPATGAPDMTRKFWNALIPNKRLPSSKERPLSVKRMLGTALFGCLLASYATKACDYTMPRIISMIQGINLVTATEQYQVSAVFPFLTLAFGGLLGSGCAALLARRQALLTGAFGGLLGSGSAARLATRQAVLTGVLVGWPFAMFQRASRPYWHTLAEEIGDADLVVQLYDFLLSANVVVASVAGALIIHYASDGARDPDLKQTRVRGHYFWIFTCYLGGLIIWLGAQAISWLVQVVDVWLSGVGAQAISWATNALPNPVPGDWKIGLAISGGVVVLWLGARAVSWATSSTILSGEDAGRTEISKPNVAPAGQAQIAVGSTIKTPRATHTVLEALPDGKLMVQTVNPTGTTQKPWSVRAFQATGPITPPAKAEAPDEQGPVPTFDDFEAQAAVNAKRRFAFPNVKPRYSYGEKEVLLTFANDLDRAAYMTAREKPSPYDYSYLKFVLQSVGMEPTAENEAAIRQYGRDITYAIKAQAKNAPALDEEGKQTILAVPDMARGRFGSQPVANVTPPTLPVAQPAAPAAAPIPPSAIPLPPISQQGEANAHTQKLEEAANPHAPAQSQYPQGIRYSSGEANSNPKDGCTGNSEDGSQN